MHINEKPSYKAGGGGAQSQMSASNLNLIKRPNMV